MSFDGVEIIINGSGSYREMRKSDNSLKLIKEATAKCGGCYVFANLKGCDGESNSKTELMIKAHQ